MLANGVTALNYTAYGVTTGQVYQFIVRARNSGGYGPYSTPIYILAG
jgi:hypothetical protein